MFISAARGVFELWIISQYTLNVLTIEMNYEFLKIVALLKWRFFFLSFFGGMSGLKEKFYLHLLITLV